MLLERIFRRGDAPAREGAEAATGNGEPQARDGSAPVIKPVQNRKDLAQFVDLPWRLYRDDALWVAPLRSEAKSTADATRNPFFRHAEVQHFLALGDSGTPLGRVAACIYPAYNERFARKTGFFGFLESTCDARVVAALLGAAEAWLERRGMTSVMGPYNYAPTQDMGLLIEGFTTPPALGQPHNPPFYQAFVQAAGYRQAWSVATYCGHKADILAELPRLTAESERLCRKHDLQLRNVDPARLPEERSLLLDVFNEAFADNREVVPIPEEVFRFQTSGLIHIIDPRLCVFVMHGGKEVGVGLALPNFNEVLIRTKGRLGVATILQWKKTMRGIKSAVVPILCVRRAAHGLGLSRILVAELLRAGVAGGYQSFHTGWVDEENGAMKAALRRFGCTTPEKRYAIYRKEL